VGQRGGAWMAAKPVLLAAILKNHRRRRVRRATRWHTASRIYTPGLFAKHFVLIRVYTK